MKRMRLVLILFLLSTSCMSKNIRENKTSKSTEYRFEDPENTACIVCEHVFNKQRPISYVTHDSDDGTWQFICGEDDHTEANAKVISLKQATEIDNSINDLYDLPLGSGAERESRNDKWVTFRIEE